MTIKTVVRSEGSSLRGIFLVIIETPAREGFIDTPPALSYNSLDFWTQVPGGFLGGDGLHEADVSTKKAQEAKHPRFPLQDGNVRREESHSSQAIER